MANKARYYGIATKEQQDLKKRAKANGGFINVEELTPWSIYSAMARVPNFDEFQIRKAVARLKTVIENEGFKGEITVKGTQISDGIHTYILTKTKEGIQIAVEEHKETKREK